MRGEAGDGESGEAVTKTALEDVAADEGSWACRCDMKRRGALAGLEHLAGCERRIPLTDHAVMIGRIMHRVMQDVAFKLCNPRAFIHLHGFVYISSTPATARAVIETQLIVRIPTAALNPLAHVEGTARDAI